MGLGIFVLISAWSFSFRLKLACLHYNENSNRAQDTTKSGEPKWHVALPKYKKGQPVAKPVKVGITYGMHT